MLDQLFQHITLFSKLDEEEKNLLNEHCNIKEIKSKQFFLHQGELCKHHYFIIKGCCRSYFVNRKGNEQIVNFGIENWWISDYDSFINGTTSRLNIQATEDTKLLYIDKPSFDLLCNQSHNLERYFRVMTEKAHIAAQRRIGYLFDLSAEEGYELFRSHNPEFLQRVPQYMLASYLGMTPEFLSKIRGKKD